MCYQIDLAYHVKFLRYFVEGSVGMGQPEKLLDAAEEGVQACKFKSNLCVCVGGGYWGYLYETSTWD